MSVLFLTLFAFAEGWAAPPAITLEDAVRLAEAQTTSVRVAESNATLAEARGRAAREARLPTVIASASVNLWTSAQEVQFIPPEAGLDCATFPAEMVALCLGLSTPITVRDQVTASASLKVIQPLTAQVAIGHNIQAAEAGLESAEYGQQVSQSDARYQAADAWFVALQAEEQSQIVAAQVRSLSARVEAARAANALGALARADLLLAELALSQAKQAALSVSVLESTAYNRLGLATGNPDGALRPSGGHQEPPRLPPDAEALVARSATARPELAQLGAAAHAADESAVAARLSRMPQVSALAVYTHTEGQGLFAEPNTAFVGASLDWQIGRVGRGSNPAQIASASAATLHAQLDGARAGVAAEVRSRTDALTAAAAAYDVATASVDVAQESLRIQEQRHAAGTATMTELLDAEAALTRARSSQASALFDARRAEIALSHAVGADPWSD